MMTFVKVLKEFLRNFRDSWSNGSTCLKLNDLMGKVKAKCIKAKSTIFTVQDITDAIGLLKGGKAAGCDHLNAEAVCSSSDYLFFTAFI